MARKGYIIGDQQSMYYLTFTVVGWIDIFTRQSYRDIVVKSFKYCQPKLPRFSATARLEPRAPAFR